MPPQSLFHAVLCGVIVWYTGTKSVHASAVTVLAVQNLRLVEDDRFTDVLPSNEIYYINSLENVSITMCALQCVLYLPYCAAILYNGGQSTCKLLKTHLNKDLVDMKSVKKGWKLFINNKACDDQWTPFNGHCYLFHETKAKMEDAETQCAQQNVYLVNIEISDENTWIWENFTVPYYQSDQCHTECWSWIGLSDRQVEGVFTWVHHNSSVTWNNWSPGEPNNAHLIQDCAIIKPTTGLWFDHECFDCLVFTCKKSM